MRSAMNNLLNKAAVQMILIDSQKVAKMLTLVICAISICVLLYEPAIAQTLDSIDTAATNLDKFIGGTFAKTVAGIALAGTGFAALFNRLSWFWFGAVILGVAIIFGRKQIIEIFATGK